MSNEKFEKRFLEILKIYSAATTFLVISYVTYSAYSENEILDGTRIILFKSFLLLSDFVSFYMLKLIIIDFLMNLKSYFK